MHVTGRESLEQQVAEARQAADKECGALRQLLDGTMQRAEAMRDAVIKGLKDELEAGKKETHDLFYKIDKVMHGETSGVVQKQGVVQKVEHLMKAQAAWEERQEGSRRDVQELQREARKFQELHEKLEPRVLMIEEAQRNSDSRAQHLTDQVRNLLASQYSSPADEAREVASAGSSSGDVRGARSVSDSITGPLDEEGEAWRWDSRKSSFSHSLTEPSVKIAAGIGRSPSADHSSRGAEHSHKGTITPVPTTPVPTPPAPEPKRATWSPFGGNQSILQSGQATQAYRSAPTATPPMHQGAGGIRSPARPTSTSRVA